MADERAPIPSYARIFKPERRVYSIEGHRLPVPGGVPLPWLGYAVGTLIAVLALSSRSWTVALILGGIAAVGARLVGGRFAAVVAGFGALGAAQVVGFVLAALDWPLRLLILPGLLATLGSQATPDGRPAHRYALSWLALQLRPGRRSLGCSLPEAGRRRQRRARLAVAADWHEWHLHRASVHGPATVRFAAPLLVAERRSRRGRRVFHPPRRLGRGARAVVDRVELAAGERLELR